MVTAGVQDLPVCLVCKTDTSRKDGHKIVSPSTAHVTPESVWMTWNRHQLAPFSTMKCILSTVLEKYQEADESERGPQEEGDDFKCQIDKLGEVYGLRWDNGEHVCSVQQEQRIPEKRKAYDDMLTSATK